MMIMIARDDRIITKDNSLFCHSKLDNFYLKILLNILWYILAYLPIIFTVIKILHAVMNIIEFLININTINI